MLGGGRKDENLTIKWGGDWLIEGIIAYFRGVEEGYSTINLDVVCINHVRILPPLSLA
jgi:hypothetical protein